ncbi:MAG: hypothetical protein ABI977_18400, partial [Acidobacteriota bacterium]
GNAGRALARFGLTADINEILPYQTATYDAFQATLNRRLASSIFGVAYTWSKAINFADNDANPRIQYYPEAIRNRGLASYDRTNNTQIYGVWDLPFGKSQRWANDGWGSKLLGGFQVNGIMSRTSGAPFYIVQGTGNNLNAPGSGQVPDQIKSDVEVFGGNLKGSVPTGADATRYQFFDRSAFAAVNIPTGQTQRFGNVGRNSLRGPGFFNLDMGLFRTFSFTEHIKLQFRFEGLNVLNHANFGNPGTDISNAGTFGFITSTVGQGSRLWRGALRLSF